MSRKVDAAELRAAVTGAGHPGLADRIDADHSLAEATTYRVGGSAAAFVTVESHDEMVALGRAVGQLGLAGVVIGKGSNLLVGDDGVDAVVVQLGEGLASIDIGPVGADGSVEVIAGGAAALPVVARRTAARGVRGFEWAVGVPGTIGGAVRMNAGGHGSDMAAVVRWVRVVDLAGGETRDVRHDALDFGYRRSAISTDSVVTAAGLGLRAGVREHAEAEIAAIVRWRRENQPGGQNAGSVFRNPPDRSAGSLIDDAGCKGLRVGGAEVSAKHANFIQVDPDGTAADVVAVMTRVRRRVREAFGVELVAETHALGIDAERAAAAGIVVLGARSR